MSLRFALPWLLVLLVSSPLMAAWERQGMTPSGAVYTIAVPDTWQAGDGLVVYQHDLRFEADTDPDLGPLLELQLAQGYAVAASGYSQSGWALFAAQRDNRELIERFRAEIGEPGRILTYGTAMGGLIALQMAEDPALAVTGTLALCPIASGHRAWDSSLDLRVLYDAICGDVAGGALPSASDHPWLVRPEDISAAGLEAVVRSVDSCTGLRQPAWRREPAQQERLDLLKAVAGIGDDGLLLLNLGYATLGLSDLVHDHAKLGGRIGLGNARVDYGDETLNASVRRVEADPFAALAFRLGSGLRGDGRARIVSLHASRDERVPPQQQSWLRQRVPPHQLTSALVSETSPGHCHLHPAEVQAAWDGLHAWIDGAAQPDAVELQSRCLALDDAGQAQGPCRIDPNLEPGPLDEVIRARNLPLETLDGRFSGNWYTPGHEGEGWLIEILSPQTALVYGFTFPAEGEPGDQHWLLGTGRIDGNGIAVDTVHSLQGGRFGLGPAQAPPRFVPWGRLDLVFDGCGRGRLRYQGPRGYGHGERTLVQLSSLAGQDCRRAAADTVAAGAGRYSGSWYDPDRPGQGIVVNADADGVGSLIFFSFDPATGEPVWLYAEGVIDGEGRMRFQGVLRQRGPRFGDGQARSLEPVDWGELELDFEHCDLALLRYEGREPGYGSGAMTLNRLTRPLGTGICQAE